MSGAILIAGTQSGVGKTTATMGILAALSKRRVVQAYKVGPDYIDPTYHTFITGRKSRNLDNYLLTDETVKTLFTKHLKDAEIAIIEGAMGLYDGSMEDPNRGSAASIAKVLQCPVILVVDGSGMAMSAAALVKGYLEFDRLVPLKGVIFNRVNTKSHYEILKNTVETHTKVKCLGYLPKNLPTLPSRHLGLVPSCEIDDLKEKIEALCTAFEKTIDLEAIIEMANTIQYEEGVQKKIPTQERSGLRMGVAYDEAFNFYYEDNLDFFREQGVEIIYFSPLRDHILPENLHFLYFGGGYPEQFAQMLSENLAIKKALLNYLEGGIPYLAECGGLMYLCQRLVDFDGKSYEMLGWLPGETQMTKSLKRFGYKTLRLKNACVLGPEDTEIKIHEFHHSELVGMDQGPIYELSKSRPGQPLKIETCGYIKGNGVAGYPHFHLYGNLHIAMNLLKAAKHFKNRN